MDLGQLKQTQTNEGGATTSGPSGASFDQLFSIIASKSKKHSMGIIRFGKWIADQWQKGNRTLDTEVVRKQIRSCFGPIDERINFNASAPEVLEQILQALEFDEEATRSVVNLVATLIP